MKLLRYISPALLSVAMFISCNEMDSVVASDEPKPATITTFDSQIEITESNVNEKLIFEWSAADFGYSASVTYSLCGVMEGGEPGVISTVNSTRLEITRKDFNRAILGVGAKGNKQNDVLLYVEASISDATPKSRSGAVSVVVTPFRVDFAPVLYVPGSHQGWSPATAPTLALVSEEDGLYDGFLDFPTANTEFKFTGQADWDPENWGGTLAALVYKSSVNITEIKTIGFYRMSVNLPRLKASYMKVNAISLIGSATAGGWDADTQLTQSADNGYIWQCSTTFVPGAFKIRFNNDWGFALGGSLDELSASGGDIAFADSGDYDVELNLSVYPHTITLTKK